MEYHKKFDADDLEWTVYDSSETQCVATVGDEGLAEAIVEFLNRPPVDGKLRVRGNIIIELDGGLVRSVIMPEYLIIDTRVFVADFDIDGPAPEDDYILVPDPADPGVKPFKVDVREHEPEAANGQHDGELAVQAFLNPALRAGGGEGTYPVEFLLAFTDRTWVALPWPVPISCPHDALLDWFQASVLPTWAGKEVAGFDVYHIGEPKEE